MSSRTSSEIAHATRYKGHNIYDPSKSSTAKKAKGSWNISYGDGSTASGSPYTDTGESHCCCQDCHEKSLTHLRSQ